MSSHIDEETPLLAGNGKTKPTSMPWFQFTIVLFLLLTEPLTSNVVYPFAPQLIRDIGITHGNESKVGYYVGLMQSVFFLTEAFTVLHWSRLSDRIGRKPVILTGVLGSFVCMYCFGLSKTFWGLMLSRGLSGALNGNVGVIKSMVAEMVDTTNISRAYAYMPLAWSTGITVGPMVGGLLARPAEGFPDLFGQNTFLKEYPYFLPCAIAATFSLIAWLVTFFFLKETLPSPISIGQLFNITTGKKRAIETTGASIVTIPEPNARSLHDDCPEAERPLPLRSLLTPRVLIAAGNYASVSLVEMAFRSIQPLYLSTPIHLGGLGLPLPTIGKLLAIYGILNGVFQAFFFARIHDRWGPKKTFVMGVATAVPAFLLFPVANVLARTQGYSAVVWAAIGIQIVLGITLNMCYGAIFIVISAVSPNRASLGATNGLSQMTVSVMRAIGPAATNSLFSLSIEKGYMGGYLVYYVLVAVTIGAIIFGSMLP